MLILLNGTYFLALQIQTIKKNVQFVQKRVLTTYQKEMEEIFEELNTRPNYFKDVDHYERKRIDEMFKTLNDRPNYFKDAGHYEQKRKDYLIVLYFP